MGNLQGLHRQSCHETLTVSEPRSHAESPREGVYTALCLY